MGKKDDMPDKVWLGEINASIFKEKLTAPSQHPIEYIKQSLLDELKDVCKDAIIEIDSLQKERCNLLGIEQSSNGVSIVLEQLLERIDK